MKKTSQKEFAEASASEPPIPKGSENAGACDSLSEDADTALCTAQGVPIVAFGSLYMAGTAGERLSAALRKMQRKAGIRARDALTPSEREARSRTIAERIFESAEFKESDTIMSYRAVKGEVSLEYFNSEAVRRGKRVVYPLCVSKTDMIALLPSSGEAWILGAFGIMEPSREMSDLVMPEEIDLVLCPCSAFDEMRNRIGMGGGFYDRFLPKCVNARIAAVAFEAQKLKKVLIDTWDVTMDKVYTEKSSY